MQNNLKGEFDAIAFDCDGTLSAIEGITELARMNGHEEEVRELTEQAMSGAGLNPELFAKRLNLVRPTATQLATLGEIYYKWRTKNIELAVKEACAVRFRPIIMTSLSTMIAMLPLVIGNIGPGAGEGSRLAVGSTILGGMIISTFFTLYVTPSMYLALAKNTKRIDEVDLELKKELSKK